MKKFNAIKTVIFKIMRYAEIGVWTYSNDKGEVGDIGTIRRCKWTGLTQELIYDDPVSGMANDIFWRTIE